MEKIDWVDLSSYGFKVLLAAFEESPREPAIAVRGGRPLSDQQETALRSAGFLPVRGRHTVWARNGNSFQLKDLQGAFPDLAVRPMERREFHISVRGHNPLSVNEHKSERVSPERKEAAERPAPDPSLPTQPATPEKPKAASPFGGAQSIFAPKPMAKREIDLPQVEDLHDGILDGDLEKVNAFQARYKPSSKLGDPIATIPVNLALATQTSLRRLEEERGDLDEWVARELQWSKEEMAGYLSPEQIDAVALGVAAAEKGKGFILADQTGLGKGRVMAALLRWSVLRYGKAIFLTETANLFTDIWRDIQDIGSTDLFGAPFMLNAGATIIDQMSGEVLFKAPGVKKMSTVLAGNDLPEDSSLMLGTYSQFNRQNSAKAAYLSRVVEGTHLFLDECHNMVNDSNTRSNLDDVLGRAEATTFSSATFARNALNMGAYRPVFPESISSLDLVEVLKSGGPQMLEALSQSLAEEGLLVRREHDLSNIMIEVVQDEARASYHRDVSDHASPILSEMAFLARKVEALVEDLEMTKESKSERYYVANFGVRLSAIVRQLLTALSVDHCVELCVDALKRGEKPVVVIENTMESLMRELASEDGIAEASQKDLLGAQREAGPPSFRDALGLMLDRIMQVSCKRTGQDPERLPVEQEDLVAKAEEIRQAIARFPDLSLSPIDDIKERVEDAGAELLEKGEIKVPWAMGEISARKLQVVRGEYRDLETMDRNQTIAAFNSGALDGLVLTRAASTGLSLHASEKFKDQRQRMMLELQIPQNVVDRVQFWGRINRRGQVSTPKFKCLSTVLPFQVRLLANQNAKVAELSANVTGSTQTALSMDVPDIINPVGNDVCKSILEENPKLARRMGIALRVDPEQAAAEHYHVNKLLSRLVLLPSRNQDAIYQRVLDSYQDICRELEAKGVAPGQTRQLDGQWQTLTRHLFDPGMPEDGAVFGRPVYLTTLMRRRMARPLKGEALRGMVAKARENHAQEFGNASAPAVASSHLKELEARRREMLQRTLPAAYETVRDALNDRQDNAVKRLKERLDKLVRALGNLEAGITLTMTGEDGEAQQAMVVDITYPDLDRVHVPSAYAVRYIFPGDEKPREVSLAALLRDARLHYGIPPGEDMKAFNASAFQSSPSGEIEEVRRVLDGNLFSAVRASRAAKMGSVVDFEDEHDRSRRGVLIPKSRQDDIHTLPGTTRSKSVVMAILKSGGGPIYTNADAQNEGLTLARDAAMVRVTIPGKKRAAKPFLSDELLAITGDFKGSSYAKDAHIPPEQLSQVLDILIKQGHSFNYGGRWRMAALSAAEDRGRSAHKENETPAPAP